MNNKVLRKEDDVRTSLKEVGYFTYITDDVVDQFIMVKEKNLTVVEPITLKSFVEALLPNKETSDDFDVSPAEIIAHREWALERLLEDLLEPLNGTVLEDTAAVKYLLLTNSVWVITAEEIKSVAHEELPGYFWSHEILGHHFNLVPIDVAKKSKFYELIRELSFFVVESAENERLSHLVSFIGSIMSQETRPPQERLFILSDSTHGCYVNEEETGKSLIVEAISKLIKTVKIGGIQDYFIEELMNMFPFENLLAVIEEDSVDDLSPYYSVLEDYPQVKILIMTRLPFEDLGANQFSVYPSYASYMKPSLSLDKNMLKDMAPDEMDKFFSVMIYCSQYYLKNGLLCSGDINCRGLRALIQETSQQFVNMMTSKVRPGTQYSWIQLFDMFVVAGIFENHEIKKFQLWVYSYAWTNNFKIVEMEDIAEKSFSLIQA